MEKTIKSQWPGAFRMLSCAVIITAVIAGCTKKEPDTASSPDLNNPVKSGNAVSLLSVDLMSGNPILPVATADPDIIYANGKYYIYPTATGPNASQFHAYSSTDLLNWTDEGIVLNLANVSWAQTDGWAPSVVARNGNYYFYYTAAKKIGVAVSTSPTGPFVDKGTALATGDGTDPIDPMVFIDTDGQAYMYWGNTTFNVQRLNTDMISLTGTRSHDKPSNYFEAPYVIKRNSTYYLMYSINDFSSDDYHVEYATSSNPMGPWTTKGRITSALGAIKGPGHNAVISKPGCSEEYFFVYHRRTSTNIHERQVAIDRMFFDGAGNIMPINISVSGVTQSAGTASCLTPNPIPNGQYAIRSKVNTTSGAGLYLDIAGCATGNADVRTWTRTTCAGQKWNLTYLNNGYYKILSELPTHKSLDLDACSIERGANVQVWDVFSNDCQQWRIESVGDGWYRIMAKAGNNVLDIVNGDATPGADVRTWTWNGAAPQYWKFEAP
ncbi:putative endo-1,4-beta-xylanase [Pedobacter sp. BAL39]|uniref:family 43 glycosylhydrolase n=1 Tax=Pedobacter sp. BAL39 TaxID=391596 RepID=UPI000155981A|nr:family 43 glycosylhydrolase [Pedobacter sp. BAL39]EDM36950.1 putative endo-1,4-beta-xylanase [Pedobacter sp. BAL39]